MDSSLSKFYCKKKKDQMGVSADKNALYSTLTHRKVSQPLGFLMPKGK